MFSPQGKEGGGFRQVTRGKQESVVAATGRRGFRVIIREKGSRFRKIFFCLPFALLAADTLFPPVFSSHFMEVLSCCSGAVVAFFVFPSLLFVP